MAPKLIPTVEIEYTIEDQRQGETHTKTTLTADGDFVHLPEGTYDISDLREAMDLLKRVGNGRPPQQPLYRAKPDLDLMSKT